MLTRRSALQLGAAGLAGATVGQARDVKAATRQETIPEASLRWSFDHEGVNDDGGRLVLQGNCYLLKSPQRLMCVETSTLEPRWEHDYAFPLDDIHPVPIHGKSDAPVVFTQALEGVHVIDLESGDVVLDQEVPTGSISVLIHEEWLYLGHANRLGSRTTVYSMANGDEVWAADGNFHYLSDKIAAWDWNVGSLTMHAIDTGDVLWSSEQPDLIWTDHFEDILLACTGTTLVGIDATTGDSKWSIPVSDRSRLVTSEYGFLILASDTDIRSIDSRTGEVMWHYALSADQVTTSEYITGTFATQAKSI